ncbi:MAG: ABC transporter ATP-binding protein [Bellilinea sp.]
MALSVREIHKIYEGIPLLRGVSFDVAKGETVCLLGPSGSGKSTLLRIITGLEAAESGQVLWDGADLAGVPVHQRHFGLMFQDYALFPHRKVAENVAFGLRMQNLPALEIQQRVNEALERVNMTGFANRRVTDLSGGEQQRVALARALAPRPRLLMLDEPLGALDRALREQLGQFLRELLHETQIPAIYVTHDQEEAFAIADRLVLLNEGRVEQDGAPDQVYNRPASVWAARFLGLTNMLPGTVVGRQPLQVQTALGVFTPAEVEPTEPVGSAVSLLFRPTAAKMGSENGGENSLTGTVEDTTFRGESYRVTLRCVDHSVFQFYLPDPLPLHAKVTLVLEPNEIVCLR